MGKSKNGTAIWFTTDSPMFLTNHSPGAFKKRLGLTRDKSEYYFEIKASAMPKLKRLDGDRGAHVLFSEKKITISKSDIVSHGLTPKK